MPSKEYEHFKDFSASNVPMDERRKIWMELSNMTKGDFDKMFADQKVRQQRVPEIGQPAPDFEAELLHADRARSGETVKLSDLRGKPVALVFGSYT
jgi:hypothetical protein